MTISERLALMDEINARNEERIKKYNDEKRAERGPRWKVEEKWHLNVWKIAFTLEPVGEYRP